MLELVTVLIRNGYRQRRTQIHRKRINQCVYFAGLIAEFYLVDRGLRHRLPGFSSMGRLVILP